MKPTFEPSPMPTHTMKSGSMASGGIGRSSSTTGSTTLRTARIWPASSPSASASSAPAEKPTATRSSVAATCTQSWPLRASSRSAPITTHGAGRNSGLNGRLASTRPPATLHSARKIASEASRQLSARRGGSDAPRNPHSIISGTLLSHTAANPPLAAWSLSTCPPGRQKTSAPPGVSSRPRRSTHGHIRRVHRRRQHGQSDGGQRAEVLSPHRVRQEPQRHEQPDRGRRAEGRLAAGGARAGGDRDDVPAGVAGRGGALSRRRRPRRARETGDDPHRPQQRAALDAEEDRAARHPARRALPGGAGERRRVRREGGDAQVLERARPVLRAIGPNIFSVGPVGAGNTVKAINNMMACVNSLAMMEGLVLGRKAGLDPMTIYEVVKASSGGSKALERIPTAIVPRSFSNVAQRYQQAAMAAGLADQDTSVALTIIEKLAALE